MRGLDRHMRALELRRSGKTWAGVAAELGVSKERGRQMVLKAERHLRWIEAKVAAPEDSILNLDLQSVRVWGVLRANDITTISQLCACTERNLLMTPNTGRKTLNEIKQALVGIGRELKRGEPL